MVPLKTTIGALQRVDLAERAARMRDAVTLRQPQVEHDQVDLAARRCAHGQQLGPGSAPSPPVTGASIAVLKRSRTNAVSSATRTVLTATSAGVVI